MLSSHHNRGEKGGEEVGELLPLPLSTVTHDPDRGSEQPFIKASDWGLTLIIFVMTVLTSSEPEEKHCPVILHRGLQ